MSEPTQEEIPLIEKFRENVKDVLYDEYQSSNEYLIRWLRARDLCLEKSEKLLRASLKWRKENRVDTILHVTLGDLFTTNFPYSVDSVDREGRAVMLIPIGRWDLRKAIDAGKSAEFTDYTNQMFEKLVDKVKKAKSSNPNWPHTQATVVADWGGFSFTQLVNIKAVQGILNMASTYEAHYPEILNRCFMINCTYAFTIIFKMIKPLLAARTMDKIVIYGSNSEEWIPEVLKYIPEKELPEEYGGVNNTTEIE